MVSFPVHDCYIDHNLTSLSDEAWFHLHRQVTSKNNQHLSSVNPYLIHDITLHDVKVGVWCVMNAE
jgi:hypothetical protein